MPLKRCARARHADLEQKLGQLLILQYPVHNSDGRIPARENLIGMYSGTLGFMEELTLIVKKVRNSLVLQYY